MKKSLAISVPRQTSVLRSLRGMLLRILCLLSFAGSSFAVAQFSGPALPASAAVNRPVKLTTDPAILYPKERDIHLAPADIITIHIYGSPDFAPQVPITLDGSGQIPLIGPVHLDGLTLHQAEDLIARELVRAGMYRDPQVTVQLIESPNQVVTLTGEVRGTVPLRGSKRLFDVLAKEGGFPPTTSHIVTINRVGLDEPIMVDLGNDPANSEHADIPVFAGDTIVTARMGMIYVLGAFKTQGAYPMQQNSPITLLKATALSGGTGFEGKLSDLRVIRTVGVERQIVNFNIGRVIAGKDPDPVLQPDDIVFLPTSKMKAAIKSGGLGTLLGFASILVIATQQ